MGLRSFLRHLRTRPPAGEKVELKPLEQVVLAHLIRAGLLSIEDVRSLIESRTPVLVPGPEEVLAPLVRQGLAEARGDPQDGSGPPNYVPTPKASRLEGRIPEDPRTVTDFWV